MLRLKLNTAIIQSWTKEHNRVVNIFTKAQRHMSKLSLFILIAIAFFLQSCSPLGTPIDKRLKTSYSGYYKTCERISFDFGEQDCECTICSTDFVGHFRDKISGTYTVDSNRINIRWNYINKFNDVYKEFPLNIADSIIVSSDGDYLLLYLTLPYRSEPLTIEAQEQSIEDTEGVVLFYGILILIFLILCFPLIAIVVGIFLVVRDKRKYDANEY